MSDLDYLQEPVDLDAIDPKIKDNVEGHKAAMDLLDLIREELRDQANTRFWEIIREEVISHVGPPLNPAPYPQSNNPMGEVERKEFLKLTMPRGMFAGKTVGHVFKVAPSYLKVYASSLDWFQCKVLRFLASSTSPKNMD